MPPIDPVRLRPGRTQSSGRFFSVPAAHQGVARGLEELADALNPRTGSGAPERRRNAIAQIRADFDAQLEEGKDVRDIAAEERKFFSFDTRYAGFSSLAPGLFAEWGGQRGAEDLIVSLRERLQTDFETASSVKATTALLDERVTDYLGQVTDARHHAAFSERIEQLRLKLVDKTLTKQGEAAIQGAMDESGEAIRSIFALAANDAFEAGTPLNTKAALAEIDKKVHEAATIFPLSERQIDRLILDETIAFFTLPENLPFAQDAFEALRDENILQDSGLRKSLTTEIRKLPQARLRLAEEQSKILLAERAARTSAFREKIRKQNGVPTRADRDLGNTDPDLDAVINSSDAAQSGRQLSPGEINNVTAAINALESAEKVRAEMAKYTYLVGEGTFNAWERTAAALEGIPNSPLTGSLLRDQFDFDSKGPWSEFSPQERQVATGAVYRYLLEHQEDFAKNEYDTTRAGIAEVAAEFDKRMEAKVAAGVATKAKLDALNDEETQAAEERGALAEKFHRTSKAFKSSGLGRSKPSLPSLPSLEALADLPFFGILAENKRLRARAEKRRLEREIEVDRTAVKGATLEETTEPELHATFGSRRADVIDSIIIDER